MFRTTSRELTKAIISSQYLKKFFKSVSIRRSNLKCYKVIPTKDTHQIPKNQISVVESLINDYEIFNKNNDLKRILMSK